MSFICNVAAEMSPPFVLGLAHFFLSAKEGVNLLSQSAPGCVLLSSLFCLNPILWGIPSPDSFAAAPPAMAVQGGRELLRTCQAQPAGYRVGGGISAGSPLEPSPGCGSGQGPANSGKQPVLAGQSLSILVKVSEVLPGYLLVDCLKYQHVSLPLHSCAFQLC